MTSLALTDYMSMSGVVEFQVACRRFGLRPIIGAEIDTGEDLFVLLARNRGGYTNVCEIITWLERQDEEALRQGRLRERVGRTLKRYGEDVICLAGGRESGIRRLIAAGKTGEAEEILWRLQEVYADHLYIELASHQEEGEQKVLAAISRLAHDMEIETVATNSVCFASPDEYDLYDLLTCIRLNNPVHASHPERPRNREGYLKSSAELYPAIIPDPDAIRQTVKIADQCKLDLMPGFILPPKAWIPDEMEAATYLRTLCEKGMEARIAGHGKEKAKAQLEKELSVICDLELEEFFLVVHEVVMEAQRRDIRYAGRGSAANSLVCYLLFITHVNPLEHRLLFERFLHGGRRGTPDIDVDFDSDRRAEIIDWIEDRFGLRHTAMTATFVRYRLRSALRDTAKALGWPMELVNDLGKAVARADVTSVEQYRNRIEEIVGTSPLVDLLIATPSRLKDCPRYLGQHSGGMMLSREPLVRYTPIRASANGVRIGQMDKESVEGLGIIKLDVLGLRMMACVSEAVELIRLHEGIAIDTTSLDLEDEEIYRFLRTGRTLGLFQIESGGQMHLIAKSQPERFYDLVTQVAIFRPGPVQAGMVHPYVRRRRGLETVTYPHPDLEPILKDTLGVILFQEQILEIAHHFAGMTLQEADEFRRLMSKFRSHDGMASMRDAFVAGAVKRGVPDPVAADVFDKIKFFVGYGFCRSHASAFAQLVFVSAYLKYHHPAAYLCAFMQHRPGFYPQMTLEQEAQRFGVRTLLPHVNISATRYALERNGEGGLSIRKPLTAIKGVSETDARRIVMERLNGTFAGIEDFYRRVPLARDTFNALAQSGALDALAGDARHALWDIGIVANRIGQSGREAEETLFTLPAITQEDIPDLPELTQRERVTWDLATHSSARVHPVSLVRRQLNDWEVRPIRALFRLTEDIVSTQKPFMVTTGGLVIMRQRPGTAKGTMFMMIEDETAFIQCVLWPAVVEQYRAAWREGAVIVRGELQFQGDWRGVVVHHIWPLDNVIGGYTGYAGADGGRDRRVLHSGTDKVKEKR